MSDSWKNDWPNSVINPTGSSFDYTSYNSHSGAGTFYWTSSLTHPPNINNPADVWAINAAIKSLEEKYPFSR